MYSGGTPRNFPLSQSYVAYYVREADFPLGKMISLDRDLKYLLQHILDVPHTNYNPVAIQILNYMNLKVFEDHYTNAVDVWALGCIIYRLIAGAIPFLPGKSLIRFCEHESKFPYNNLSDNGLSAGGTDLLRGLLTPHPAKGPSVSDALKRPWITTGALQILIRARSILYSTTTGRTGNTKRLLPAYSLRRL